RPHELSGGQRQRGANARALAVEPDLLIADEPTSMLDVSLRVDVLNLLLRLRDERRLAILFITHDLASARYLSDRILVMSGGAVVETGRTEELLARPSHPYTRRLLAATPEAARETSRTQPRGDAVHQELAE
ncbi:MAG: ABC transporter ATP-binding protein, partial [Myxococcales bacterium]|nr:ABC transporter ATP-binding protein [Myxococcales bacterium]